MCGALAGKTGRNLPRRAAGRWNPFLPHSLRAPEGLSNLDYASLCEIMGRVTAHSEESRPHPRHATIKLMLSAIEMPISSHPAFPATRLASHPGETCKQE